MHLPFIVINILGYLRVRYPRLVKVYSDSCQWIPEDEVSKVSVCLYRLLLLLFADTLG